MDSVWFDKGEWISVDEALKRGVPEEIINAAQLEADELVYGISCTDITGKRIDPLTLS